MEIRGRHITTNERSDLPVAIVTLGNKRIGAAVIVCTDNGYSTHNVALANAAIATLASVADQNGLCGRLHKVTLGTEAGTASRIEMSLACASDGDIAVFMCADAAIFELAWRTLNVRT